MFARSVAAIAASICTATSVPAQSVSPDAGTGPAVLAKVSAATVMIEVQGVCCGASGSGLLLTRTGLIATSAHIIAGARQVRVRLSSGETFEAVGTLTYDPRLDLAIIVIPGVGLPSAPLANSDKLVVGQRLRAIGVSTGQGTTVTDALLSAVHTEDGVRWLQMSVPVSPRSSGGPIVNEQGDVVGLVVAGAPGGAEHFNVAIPINDVRGEAGRLGGRTPTPFLEMAYGEPAYPPVGVPPGDAPLGAAAGVARTDPALDLDFRPLSGVVLYFEEQYSSRHRVRDSTGYAVSLTPAGSLGVERSNSREWRDQDAGVVLAAQQLRTDYDIGQSDRWTSVFTLRPLVSAIPTDSWELHAEGGRYWYSAVDAMRTGETTPGLVPREMLSAVVAALPDSLPPEVHVWVLDAVSNRSQEVVVRFGPHETRMVPVPLAGQQCRADVPTRSVPVEVVQGTRRTGTEVVGIVVLARRPHVTVGGAASGMTSSLKCVMIPGVVP